MKACPKCGAATSIWSRNFVSGLCPSCSVKRVGGTARYLPLLAVCASTLIGAFLGFAGAFVIITGIGVVLYVILSAFGAIALFTFPPAMTISNSVAHWLAQVGTVLGQCWIVFATALGFIGGLALGRSWLRRRIEK